LDRDERSRVSLATFGDEKVAPGDDAIAPEVTTQSHPK